LIIYKYSKRDIMAQTMTQTILASATLIGTDIDDNVGIIQVNGCTTIQTPSVGDNSTRLATQEFISGLGSGVTFSTTAPINPDINPVNKKWVQLNPDRTIASVYEWTNNSWNV
jgi:hypothetical protein